MCILFRWKEEGQPAYMVYVWYPISSSSEFEPKLLEEITVFLYRGHDYYLTVVVRAEHTIQ